MRHISEMGSFLQPEEDEICQESQLAAEILQQQEALSRAELQQDKAPQIQMQLLHKARKQYAKLLSFANPRRGAM
jgi:hypothetical protein